jgi:hypothetical protein
MSACARCQSPIEEADLRCAICSLPTTRVRGSRTTIAEVLRCDQCGAAVSYDAAVQAPRCAFCASVMHLERSEDPIEEAEAYLPFRVDPNAAQAALKQWLGTRGFFSPTDLQSAATIASLRPIWWVGWIFQCDALVSWAADSDYGNGRSAWAPHAGQSPLSLSNVLVSASRGLTHEETRQLTPHFDLASARAEPHAMDGALIERFDVQRSAARVILAQAIESTSASYARGWIPGTRYRNLRVSPLLKRLSTRRVALPSYVLAYHYAGTLYRVVVHGQDARCLIGDSPFSYRKLAMVILAVLLALGAIVGVAFLLFVIFAVAAQ